MNYYSRNSPVKHKKSDLPPGFLLQPHPSVSQHPTSRSKITPHPHHQNSSASYFESQSSMSSQEILILDDDSYNVPTHQILIQDDLTSQQQSQNQFQMIQEQSQSEESQSQIDASDVNKECQEANKDGEEQQGQIWRSKDKDQDKLDDATIKDKKQHQSKPILRNYSFGNQNQLWESSSQGRSSIHSADPFIRRLIHPDAILKMQNSKSKKSFHPKTNKTKTQKIPIKQQKEENWKKMIAAFIKKRQNWKQQKKNQQDKLNQQSETGERNSEAIILKKQEELGSEQSGYFPQIKKQMDAESSNSNEEYDDDKRTLFEQEEKTQKQQSGESNRFEKYEITVLRQKEQQIGYEKSLALLNETIQELPKQIVPHYLNMHNQLVIKQLRNRETMKRQSEMIQMMKIMTKMQSHRVYVDQFILKEFSAQQEQRVVGNQQIILSLIRTLASHF